jgi:hypothetical protein
LPISPKVTDEPESIAKGKEVLEAMQALASILP